MGSMGCTKHVRPLGSIVAGAVVGQALGCRLSGPALFRLSAPAFAAVNSALPLPLLLPLPPLAKCTKLQRGLLACVRATRTGRQARWISPLLPPLILLQLSLCRPWIPCRGGVAAALPDGVAGGLVGVQRPDAGHRLLAVPRPVPVLDETSLCQHQVCGGSPLAVLHGTQLSCKWGAKRVAALPCKMLKWCATRRLPSGCRAPLQSSTHAMPC